MERCKDILREELPLLGIGRCERKESEGGGTLSDQVLAVVYSMSEVTNLTDVKGRKGKGEEVPE